MRLKMIAAAVCGLFSIATAALADTHIGWYVAADIGAHQKSSQRLTVTDTEVISSSSSSSSSGDDSSTPPEAAAFTPRAAAEAITTDDAYTGPYSLRTRNDAAYFVRGGYQFTPNWRAELELGQRLGKINHSIATDISESGWRGKQNMTSAMLNLLLDISPESNVHPYLGIGAGAVHVKTDYEGVANPTTEVSQSYSIHESKTIAAGQLIAGLTWQVSDRLNLDLTYRYLQTGKSHYDVMVHRQYTESTDEIDVSGISPRVAAALNPTVRQTVIQDVVERDRMSGRFNDQSLTIGLRWAFGAPPPPAPIYEAASPSPAPEPAPAPQPQPVPLAAPAPAPVPSYIVYFEFDRSTITPDGQSVVDAAAGYARTNSPATVTVVGHADTSGSAAYNIKLSERRAKMVASALVKDGVPSAVISTDWKGESQPAVLTGDGVKEPLNRRATIDFAF